MLTDKQIEREEAFCEDWYMTRKMGKTPTYADAIAWAEKTMIEALAVIASQLAESVLMDWDKEEQVRLAKEVACECHKIFNEK